MEFSKCIGEIHFPKASLNLTSRPSLESRSLRFQGFILSVNISSIKLRNRMVRTAIVETGRSDKDGRVALARVLEGERPKRWSLYRKRRLLHGCVDFGHSLYELDTGVYRAFLPERSDGDTLLSTELAIEWMERLTLFEFHQAPSLIWTDVAVVPV